MALNKNLKSSIIQIAIGVALYFILNSSSSSVEQKEASLIVGDLYDAGVEYESIFFKDSEYFGNFAKPESYLKNWYNLLRVLDKIRYSFGSAVLITRGYEASATNLIKDSFEVCLSAEIAPQNKDLAKFIEVVKDLISKKNIVLADIVKVGTSLKITINE